MRLVFDRAGWEDYQWWQTNDRRLLKRINLLIDDALRTPGEGRGQPERLKQSASDVWSRRVTQQHRLVYRIIGADLIVLLARFHYYD
ncbi:MAG: Txe/YoeB family addiction module toxin [Kineosporiaceae bacterium]|nr:Txe/YoeB family addiction module toxin [Aeromicrobium sp.]